ncbi:DUF4190 domain-containing protein [Streptomyces roseicoloratus]|uniref:DUF4190 domain-containing protein n=1 Tax=Streptomyces roseicoloratus TaxID=2508722 RepID=A0ABY9RSR8_9ACTN|nr:DUF4190 domain-containing protein [Streptomyces roseicoloratus]WMX45237.1 DUF4190 domain-containing protein [Streptomyces roseicoloratus]
MSGAGPYGMPQQTTNGLAVASLVSGIVCCLPPLGLVLGLIALPQARKKQQKGAGMAIAGIVLSALSSLLLVIGLVTGGIGDVWREFEKGMDEAASAQSPFSLRTGDCFRVKGKLESYTTDVDTVPCDTPHEGEVTGGFKLTGFTRWPGESAIDRVAEERCDRTNSAYAMDTWAVPEDALVYYYMPTKESWRVGDRTVTCAFATEKEPFTVSLRSDQSTLDAHQVHYLRNVNPIDDALFAEPEEDVDTDLAVNTAWAARVHKAVTSASSALRGHAWPDASAKPVSELTRKLDAAAVKWKKLATAEDAEAFWDVYEEAYDALSTDFERESRASLKLTETLEGDGARV